ncbi:MAG: DHH family phosphoesterase [Bacilli bacterium]|nr:DHH family phosphoesterase [Bacilli bacterium]
MNNFFDKLNALINKYDNFILMGHKNPDLDVLGSSLALYGIIKERHKHPYIFINVNDDNNYNDSIKKSLQKYNFTHVYDDNYRDVLNNCLLIIVDTHQPDRLEYSKILDNNIDTVVIDHHIMHQNYITDTVLCYNDTKLSSIVELMTYYADYCNVSLNPIISTIMLAGLEIDTSSYNLKTSENTYIAASYLMKMGADVMIKQELLKESKDDYIRRADYIKNSFMINGNIAMCILNNVCMKEELAEIADELLKFVSVEASFVIGELRNGNIGISARSIKEIDVEAIMKYFDGGGHSTHAAAEVKDKTIQEIKNEIIEKVVKK